MLSVATVLRKYFEKDWLRMNKNLNTLKNIIISFLLIVVFLLSNKTISKADGEYVTYRDELSGISVEIPNSMYIFSPYGNHNIEKIESSMQTPDDIVNQMKDAGAFIDAVDENYKFEITVSSYEEEYVDIEHLTDKEFADFQNEMIVLEESEKMLFSRRAMIGTNYFLHSSFVKGAEYSDYYIMYSDKYAIVFTVRNLAESTLSKTANSTILNVIKSIKGVRKNTSTELSNKTNSSENMNTDTEIQVEAMLNSEYRINDGITLKMILFAGLFVLVGIIGLLQKVIYNSKKQKIIAGPHGRTTDSAFEFDFTQVPFSDYSDIEKQIAGGNIRYLTRSVALYLASIQNKFKSFGFSAIILLGIVLPVVEAVLIKNWLILLCIPFIIIGMIYEKQTRKWMTLIAVFVGVFIPYESLFFSGMNYCICKLLYWLWYNSVKELAAVSLLKNPDFFIELWNDSKLAIEYNGDIFFKNSNLDRKQVNLNFETEAETYQPCDTSSPIESDIREDSEKIEKSDIQIADFNTSQTHIVDDKNVESRLDDEKIDQIRRWKSLYDEGIISQEEFDKQRKSILGL